MFAASIQAGLNKWSAKVGGRGLISQGFWQVFLSEPLQDIGSQ